MNSSSSPTFSSTSQTSRENYHLCLRFEYGPMDDGTLWIKTPSRNLFHVDWLTLRLLLELNGGRSVSDLAEKYKIEIQELQSIILSLGKEGAIVQSKHGKIIRGRQTDDINPTPLVFLFITLGIIQIEYFQTIARTIYLNHRYEGVLIGLISMLPIVLHELGHYLTAKPYFPPRFGFTHLLFFPAVYIDTHPAWCLPRNIRLLINSAGLLSDLIFNTLLVILVLYYPSLEYYVTPILILQYTRWTLILNPMVNGDGYWLLADFSKTVNLKKRGAEHLRSGKIHWLSLYGLFSLVFSIFSVIGLAWLIINLVGRHLFPFLF